MSCHMQEGLPAAQSGVTLEDMDVYKVSAVTASGDPTTGQAELDLNCEEMKHVYETSCARAMADFETFYNEVQQSANAGASEVYADSSGLNTAWETNPAGQRIASIRICIRWRWIRIYISWKI